MSEDKELLTLAAKAVGIRLEWDGDPKYWTPMYYEGKTYHTWNPLTDDADALRLAVKLGIEIGFYSTLVRAAKQDQDWIGEDYGNDPYAATRRAIVRAASEIGRGME